MLSLTSEAPHGQNASLVVAVALSTSLGASVPLSTGLFDPSVRGSAAADGAPTASIGSAAWAALQAAKLNAVNHAAVAMLLGQLASLLRAAAAASAEAQHSTGREPIVIRMAGGFVLNLEQPFSAEHRVGLLFSLPGSTMLDTLLGLLLAGALAPGGRSGEQNRAEPCGEGVLDSPSSQLQLALLRFLNTHVLSDAAADALAPLLRRHMATRHLRAYTLLLQFGAAGDDASRLQLRQMGFLLASRGFLNEQLQRALVNMIIQGGRWPLELPLELVAFYSRVLLMRIQQRRRGGRQPHHGSDDALLIEILDAVLSALRGATRAEAADGGGADLVILPLPHTQLVLLLWHSLSAVARGSFIAKTTAAVCEVVDAGEARSGAPRAALLRLLLLLEAFLRLDTSPSQTRPCGSGPLSHTAAIATLMMEWNGRGVL